MPRHVRTGAVCWPNFHVFNPFEICEARTAANWPRHCKKFTFKTGSDPPGWNFNKREHWREDDLTETGAERSHISIHLAFIKRILWSNWFVILDGSSHIVLFLPYLLSWRFSMVPKKHTMKGYCSQEVLNIPHCRRVRPAEMGKTVKRAAPVALQQALAFWSTQWTTLRIGMPKTMRSVVLFLATFRWKLGCRDIEIDEDVRQQKMRVSSCV